jgi:hypothetical protein
MWLVLPLVSAMPGVSAAGQTESGAALEFVEVLEVGDSRWRATGTVSADDQNIWLAIIEDFDTGAAVLVRKGSWIFDGVKVEDVSRDSVTFFVDGKRMAVRVSPGSSGGGAAEAVILPAIEIEQKTPSRFRMSYGTFRNMLGAASLSSSKDSFVGVRNSDNESLLQIKNVHPSGTLDRLGLEAGDVIIAMQGEAIEGLAHAEDVLNEIQPGSTLLVAYGRAGAIWQLSVEITNENVVD